MDGLQHQGQPDLCPPDFKQKNAFSRLRVCVQQHVCVSSDVQKQGM